MSKLLITMAAIEPGAGLAVAALPNACVDLLLGSSLETPLGFTMARIIGAALFSLGLACWLARRDEQSQAAIGLIVAVLFYNIAISTALVMARIEFGLQGLGLWPGAVLHLVMAVWCIACLRNRSNKTKLTV